MRPRLRHVVWRELPFSARRAIVGTLRTIDRWENRVHRLWRSVIDSLDDSPAWLFVAIVGVIGIGLTILLFFSLAAELQAARTTGPVRKVVIEPAALPTRSLDELDSRLCLDTTPVAPQPYPAEFDFRGVMLADQDRRPVPPSARAATPRTSEDDFPPWEELPEFPRREHATSSEPDHPRRSDWPPLDEGEPELDLAIDWSHRPAGPQLAEVAPEVLMGRSADSVAEGRMRLAVLSPSDRDGWTWFRDRFTARETPQPYLGLALPAGSPSSRNLTDEDATAVPARTEVALRMEWHGPATANVQQPERTFLVVQNTGRDAIRRLQVLEPASALGMLTAADPPAALADGRLTRELPELRRGRDRTFASEWYPQSTGRHAVGAQVLAEAAVAAVVQVEREPESRPEPVRTQTPPPLPERQPAVAPPVRTEAPAPRPVARLPQPQPGLDCTVRHQPRVAVRDVVELAVDVRNTGGTSLEDVRIWVHLPGALAHRHGPRLEYVVGELAAGASHRAVLRLVGTQAGTATARVRAFAGENAQSDTLARVDVIEPREPRLAQPLRGPGCPCVAW